MTRIAFLLSSIAPLAFAAVPAAAQSMDHSTHGSTPAPAPSPSPAQVAKPAPEAPAEQMDHDSMPGMDMEPKAPSCSPEHAAMGHCTPEAGPPGKKAPHIAPQDHDLALPAVPHRPPPHAKQDHCPPTNTKRDE